MNTPDTEERKFLDQWLIVLKQAHEYQLQAGYPSSLDELKLMFSSCVRTLLSSRDTYWKEREALTSEREYLRGFREAQYLEKERVRKEVEGMRVDCRHEEGHDMYREHCATYGGTCKHQGWNQALDTLLDNLK